MMAPSNPPALRVLERLGATTVNVPSDMTLAQLAEMRAASSLPIDLYVEAPDGLGGVVRGNELATSSRSAPRCTPSSACATRAGSIHPASISSEMHVRSRGRRCIARRSRSSGCAVSRRSSSQSARAHPGSASRSPQKRTEEGRCPAKRRFAIIVGVVAVAAVGVLPGPHSPSPPTKHAGVTLTLWHNYGTEGNAVATKNLVAAFEKANPNITIKVVSQPADNYFALFQAASIAHTGPDIAVQWTGLFDLKYEKFLLNLKPYFTAAEIAKINGAKWMAPDFDTARACS